MLRGSFQPQGRACFEARAVRLEQRRLQVGQHCALQVCRKRTGTRPRWEK